MSIHIVIKKMWYIGTIEYYSVIKKKKNAICSNMDGPTDCQTEWSKLDRERQLSWYLLYVESKKTGANELTYKTEIESQM